MGARGKTVRNRAHQLWESHSDARPRIRSTPARLRMGPAQESPDSCGDTVSFSNLAVLGWDKGGCGMDGLPKRRSVAAECRLMGRKAESPSDTGEAGRWTPCPRLRLPHESPCVLSFVELSPRAWLERAPDTAYLKAVRSTGDLHR